MKQQKLQLHDFIRQNTKRHSKQPNNTTEAFPAQKNRCNDHVDIVWIQVAEHSMEFNAYKTKLRRRRKWLLRLKHRHEVVSSVTTM